MWEMVRAEATLGIEAVPRRNQSLAFLERRSLPRGYKYD
jgi:hypothetical protein